MPKKKIVLQIILLIICNTININSCEDSETKIEKSLKSIQSPVIDTNQEKKSLKSKKKENFNPISKPYEVTEEITEYVPLPYHIQRKKLLTVNKTDDPLQVAESRYNVPSKTTHQYQVTEDIDEEEIEDNRSNDISVEGSSYLQNLQTPHYINILYNVNNSNLQQNSEEEHNSLKYTTVNYRNKPDNVKQPLSLIVLHPTRNKNQVQRPLRVKVLKPVILSDQDTDHDDEENGNVIIRNDNRRPLLTLSVLKSYVPYENKFNYYNNYHPKNHEDIQHSSTVKPILVKVMKPNTPKEPNKYKKLYDKILHDGYEQEVKPDFHTDYKETNTYREELDNDEISNEYRSVESDYKPDKKQYFIYVVDKEKPYVYIKRINKHR